MVMYTSFRPFNRKGSGIGMILYSTICTIQFCHDNNLQYVHTPLPDIFERKFNMNKLFSNQLSPGDVGQLNSIFKPNQQHSITTLQGYKAIKITNMFNINRILESKSQLNLKHTMQLLRVVYDYGRVEPTNFHDICIHVRRGDCDRKTHKRNAIRRVNDMYVNKCLDKISNSEIDTCNVTIHSDSKLDTTKYAEYYNLNIHYNTPTVNNYRSAKRDSEAMHHMINCDALYRTKCSAFSGICALYNRNKVYSDNDYNLFKINQTS